MPYVATNARSQMREFYPPPYGSLAPAAFRRPRRGPGARGMGDQATAATASILGGIAPFTGPAAPFVALAATLTGLFGQVFSGCGQTCTLTSEMANKLEQFLQQNLQLYFSSGRTQSEQTAALANFNSFWNQLVQYCGQASMGSAGQRCISDRQSGACKWQASAPSWSGCNYSGAGAAGSGSACWNWWIGYHDPIANDPCVVPDAQAPAQSATMLTPSGTVTQVVAGGGSSAPLTIGGLTLDPTTLLVGVGLILGGLLLFGGGK